MKKSRLLGAVCVCVCFLALSTTANAVSLIDQNNPTIVSDNGFCAISGDLCGQSFQQSQTNISGAGIFLSTLFPGSGNITISIYENYGALPSGLIASGTSSLVNQDSGWVDVFWSPETILSSTTYYLVLESTESNLTPTYSDPGSYALGNALYQGSDSDWVAFDLTFRTYYDGSAVVPVPPALWLFGSGLLGLIGVSRRKKAA